MEDTVGKFCKSLAAFCNHLETSCDALKQSVDRRPIPLDSASTTFVQSVNRRVAAASNDLNLLESMAFGTVSFEELLGHCKEVFNRNQNDLLALQDHLCSSSNYIPPLDFNDDDDDNDEERRCSAYTSLDSELKRNAEYDPLLDDSLSLKNFGLSDVCIETIASQANSGTEMNEPYQEISTGSLEVIEGKKGECTEQFEDPEHLINITQEQYEGLPKPMKSLASWEDILVAVEKINTHLRKKGEKPNTFLTQEEIESLGLGFKARSYLLLLIKMNQLCVETIDGLISYRIL